MPAPDRSEARSFFGGTSVSEYLTLRGTARAQSAGAPRSWAPHGEEDGAVVLVNHDSTAAEVLGTLAMHRILSAPMVIRTTGLEDAVWGEDVEEGGAGAYYGNGAKRIKQPGYQVQCFVGVKDIVESLVEWVGADAADADGGAPVGVRAAHGGGSAVGTLLSRMGALSSMGQAFSSRKAITLARRPDGDLVWDANAEQMPMLDLVESGLLRWPPRAGAPPAHRVGVFNAHGEILDIISQSDVVAWAADHAWKLGEVGSATLADAGAVRPAPATFSSAAPAIDCFAELARLEISGGGIVDASTGALCGNLSESDLRGMLPTHFGALALPVAEFVVHKHALPLPSDPAALDGWEPGEEAWKAAVADPYARVLLARRPPLVAADGETVASAAAALARARVHRMYVVDAATGKPTGVTTLTDLLTAMLEDGEKRAKPAKA